MTLLSNITSLLEAGGFKIDSINEGLDYDCDKAYVTDRTAEQLMRKGGELQDANIGLLDAVWSKYREWMKEMPEVPEDKEGEPTEAYVERCCQYFEEVKKWKGLYEEIHNMELYAEDAKLPQASPPSRNMSLGNVVKSYSDQKKAAIGYKEVAKGLRETVKEKKQKVREKRGEKQKILEEVEVLISKLQHIQGDLESAEQEYVLAEVEADKLDKRSEVFFSAIDEKLHLTQPSVKTLSVYYNTVLNFIDGERTQHTQTHIDFYCNAANKLRVLQPTPTLSARLVKTAAEAGLVQSKPEPTPFFSKV
eukprot:TRINITY_DN2208_c0_g1_i1.p1 TRINITY_DN2208_c0_g1~~TRINITY_DN2208_c0_g1_i1.p1  ORF type:complete len:328 (+),score=66.56 TRINITY_DN2208_c0_g1_i1:69-986(+)